MPEETYALPQTWPNFFVAELVHQRTARGWGQRRLAREANVSASTIANIESGLRPPTVPVAQAIDRALRAKGLFERLAVMVLRSSAKGSIPSYLAAERMALSMQVWQPLAMPGLLQTEDYARAMFSRGRVENMESLLAARMARKDIFDGDVQPYCRWIVEEQVLRRPIGGPEVMRAQLENILRVVDHPRRSIQILDASKPFAAGIDEGFSIFEIPDEGRPIQLPDELVFEAESNPIRTRKILWADGFIEGRVTDDVEQLLRADHAFDLMISTALSPDESMERIREILKAYEEE